MLPIDATLLIDIVKEKLKRKTLWDAINNLSQEQQQHISLLLLEKDKTEDWYSWKLLALDHEPRLARKSAIKTIHVIIQRIVGNSVAARSTLPKIGMKIKSDQATKTSIESFLADFCSGREQGESILEAEQLVLDESVPSTASFESFPTSQPQPTSQFRDAATQVKPGTYTSSASQCSEPQNVDLAPEQDCFSTCPVPDSNVATLPLDHLSSAGRYQSVNGHGAYLRSPPPPPTAVQPPPDPPRVVAAYSPRVTSIPDSIPSSPSETSFASARKSKRLNELDGSEQVNEQAKENGLIDSAEADIVLEEIVPAKKGFRLSLLADSATLDGDWAAKILSAFGSKQAQSKTMEDRGEKDDKITTDRPPQAEGRPFCESKTNLDIAADRDDVEKRTEAHIETIEMKEKKGKKRIVTSQASPSSGDGSVEIKNPRAAPGAETHMEGANRTKWSLPETLYESLDQKGTTSSHVKYSYRDPQSSLQSSSPRKIAESNRAKDVSAAAETATDSRLKSSLKKRGPRFDADSMMWSSSSTRRSRPLFTPRNEARDSRSNQTAQTIRIHNRRVPHPNLPGDTNSVATDSVKARFSTDRTRSTSRRSYDRRQPVHAPTIDGADAYFTPALGTEDLKSAPLNMYQQNDDSPPPSPRLFGRGASSTFTPPVRPLEQPSRSYHMQTSAYPPALGPVDQITPYTYNPLAFPWQFYPAPLNFPPSVTGSYHTAMSQCDASSVEPSVPRPATPSPPPPVTTHSGAVQELVEKFTKFGRNEESASQESKTVPPNSVPQHQESQTRPKKCPSNFSQAPPRIPPQQMTSHSAGFAQPPPPYQTPQFTYPSVPHPHRPIQQPYPHLQPPASYPDYHYSHFRPSPASYALPPSSTLPQMPPPGPHRPYWSHQVPLPSPGLLPGPPPTLEEHVLAGFESKTASRKMVEGYEKEKKERRKAKEKKAQKREEIEIEGMD